MVSHLFFCVCACLVAFAIVAGNSEEHSSETSEKAKFKSVPTTVKTFENDSVLLPCYLENAGTTYHVRWIKDKQLIADSSDQDLIPPDRVRLYSNHSIQVVRLTPNDTGDYVCEVVRPEPWSVIRQVHAIEVLHPAEVVAIPEIGLLQVGEGEMVDMSCKATGVPQPIITWNYNGKPLELLIDKPRLTFNASTRHLSGIYECIATNGVRDPARASIQLDILHPPIVWAASPWVHTAVGLSARLECHVTASPVARIHWFHGQMPLRPSGRAVWHEKGDLHQLLIRNVKDADLGSYTCKAENRKGMAEAKIFLSGVANVAVFKMDPSKTVPTQTTFTLIWEVDSYSPIIEYNLWFRPYKPRPPQKEGVVMIKDKDNSWTKMTIPGDGSEGPVNTAFYVLGGLTPATAYEAQVISRNRYGWSKPSSIFHFFTRDYENKSGEKNYFTPPFEDGFFENVVLNTNASDFYATAESMEPEKIYSSSSPNSQNRAHNIIPFSLSFVSSLLVCFRSLL